MIETVEIERKELEKLTAQSTFPHSEAFLTVLMPSDQVHAVQNNLYQQLDGARGVVERNAELKEGNECSRWAKSDYWCFQDCQTNN